MARKDLDTHRRAAKLTSTWWAVIAAVTFSVSLSSQASAPGRVRIDSGELQGVVAGEIVSFKNIPYAAPPVGSLRWRPPQPVTPWIGVRQADKVGALCMQAISPTDNGVGPPPVSEDCLTLNVFAPAMKSSRPLAVMFWIHGGGFVNGSGTAALYDGTELAKQGWSSSRSTTGSGASAFLDTHHC